MIHRSRNLPSFRLLGPGLVMAATGIGVGDLVATAVAGSRFGASLGWTVVGGALMKYTLSEGIARHQLTVRAPLFSGRLKAVFFVYVVLWSLVAGAAVISACGLAAHALLPFLSQRQWAVFHSLAAGALVTRWQYRAFERAMALFVGVMFLTLCGAAPWGSAFDVVRLAALPAGSLSIALSVLGGVGGSVTLLSYAVWMRERGWSSPSDLPTVRADLAVTYLVTAIFGISSLLLAGKTGIVVGGEHGLLQMSTMLGAFRAAYVVGFWCAATSSLLGTWQSVPHLVAETMGHPRLYRPYLFFLSVAPIALVFLGEPFALILSFTVVGSLFIPLLAASLLFTTKNGALAKAALGATLIFFLLLAARSLPVSRSLFPSSGSTDFRSSGE